MASLLNVASPCSGLEVVVVHENGAGPMYKFHNLGNQHVESRLWSTDMLKEGSLRHYALRMYLDQDHTVDDTVVNWLGNIGYLRRSYTAADLIYRDPYGQDHVYYGRAGMTSTPRAEFAGPVIDRHSLQSYDIPGRIQS